MARPSAIRVINTGHQLPAPLATSDCQALFRISCYTPLQYRTAYDVSPLYRDGITGVGQTIVIVDSFGSPTVGRDLQTFDAEFGLPNPDLQIIPFGAIPPFDPTNSDEVGWATETTLDVEYAHAMAPGAKIVLAETAVSETEGVTGFPEMMAAEKYLIDQGIGDVISQSFGATENTFPGFPRGHYSSLLRLRYAFTDAAAHRVTVLGGSGDFGPTDYRTDGRRCTSIGSTRGRRLTRWSLLSAGLSSIWMTMATASRLIRCGMTLSVQAVAGGPTYSHARASSLVSQAQSEPVVAPPTFR